MYGDEPSHVRASHPPALWPTTRSVLPSGAIPTREAPPSRPVDFVEDRAEVPAQKRGVPVLRFKRHDEDVRGGVEPAERVRHALVLGRGARNLV